MILVRNNLPQLQVRDLNLNDHLPQYYKNFIIKTNAYSITDVHIIVLITTHFSYYHCLFLSAHLNKKIDCEYQVS